jgi:tetratricopeptide (TPR) repeat protein
MSKVAGRASEPLRKALNWSFTFGFPVEVWVAIATALAPEGVEYRPRDAEAFARAHPNQVERYDGGEGVLYRPPFDPQTDAFRAVLAEPGLARQVAEAFGPFTIEDRVAVALVGLLRSPAKDRPGVWSYLRRYLPAQCADGEGRGIDALGELAGEPEVDRLLATALSRRAARLPARDAIAPRREAIALFESLGERGEAAGERATLSSSLRAAGDLEGALHEMNRALNDYRTLSARNPFHRRFVALTLLNLGTLYRAAGRRRDAVTATKAAVSEFERIAREDHRFADEVRLAKAQLRRIRWRR